MNVPKPQTAKEAQFEKLFSEFVAMGEQRSYGKLCRKHGIEAPALMRHAKQFLWPERINTLQIQANEQTSTAVDPAEAVDSEINRLHLSRLKLLQKRAMDYLEACTFDKPEAAVRCLVETMKLEREIKGLTRDKTEDLRAILERRIREAADLKGPASTEPEFTYDPNLKTEEIDGTEGNLAPPGGGDHAERREDPVQPDGG